MTLYTDQFESIGLIILGFSSEVVAVFRNFFLISHLKK